MSKKISAEEFVKVWQKSSNVHEVVEATGIRLGTVYQKCRRYRNLGIELKRFNDNSMDIDALKKLAKSLAPKD